MDIVDKTEDVTII